MRFKELRLLVGPEDLAPILSRVLPADKVASLNFTAENGCLHIQGEHKLGFIPISIDLALRITSVQEDALEFTLSSSKPSGAMIQEVLQGKIRSARIEGLQMEHGRLTFRPDGLSAALKGAKFRFRSAAITPDGIELAIKDLMLPIE